MSKPEFISYLLDSDRAWNLAILTPVRVRYNVRDEINAGTDIIIIIIRHLLPRLLVYDAIQRLQGEILWTTQLENSGA